MRIGARYRHVVDRFSVCAAVVLLIAAIIVGKLFWIQVVRGSSYAQLAETQNSRGVVLPARRGTIFSKDYRTGELFPLAQNTTSYTVFADPLLIEPGEEVVVAEALMPLLFAEDVPIEKEPEEALSLPQPQIEEVEEVLEDAVQEEAETPEEEIQEEPLEPAATKEITESERRQTIIERLSRKQVTRRIITDTTDEERELVEKAFLEGVSIEGEHIIINPTLIDDGQTVARQLAAVLSADPENIFPLTQRRKVRYVPLKRNVSAIDKDAVMALNIRGIGANPQYERVYPEETLAAQVVGFVNNEGEGSAGIEGYVDSVLAGTDGLRRTQVDPFNRQITVGDVTINEAVDGADVVLTIDRAMQAIAEEELALMVENQRADSGQVIIMQPTTGAILALAEYPTYNPNGFGDVFTRETLEEKTITTEFITENGDILSEEEIVLTSEDGIEAVEEFTRQYIVRDDYRFPIFREGESWVTYENRLGPGVFTIKSVNEPYEPGSIFKALAIAAGIDSGVMTPGSISDYSGPVQLDEFVGTRQIVIRNALNQYFGRETVQEILMHSSNVGMAWIAQTLGRAVLYEYIRSFGIGEKTGISLPGEASGVIENANLWSEAELITRSFGQGVTATVLQMALAYSAMANGGLLMQPYIVAEEQHPRGRTIAHRPKVVRRVMTPESSATMTGLLIASVDKGFSGRGAVPGYFVGGKTGTSQTYAGGRALTEVGTTIASYAGFAPATAPEFVIVVKIDRPRFSQWGSAVAAPVFQRISERLLRNYYAIAPKNK